MQPERVLQAVGDQQQEGSCARLAPWASRSARRLVGAPRTPRSARAQAQRTNRLLASKLPQL
eukprot:2331417-Alexandrium_andersonii.AAC.1